VLQNYQAPSCLAGQVLVSFWRMILRLAFEALPVGRGAMSVLVGCAGLLLFTWPLQATPPNKAALERHYDKFLAKDLVRCTTCHLPSENKNPASLDEFPHNPFGQRLRVIGKELAKAGKRKDIPARLRITAKEDSDGDGVDNETE